MRRRTDVLSTVCLRGPSYPDRVELVRVVTQAADPLASAGLAAMLGGQPGIAPVPIERRREADVAVVAADRLTTKLVTGLRRAAAEFGIPVLLVIDAITEGELLVAIECRVAGVIPRAAVTAERLSDGVRSVAAGARVPSPSLEVLGPPWFDEVRLTPREIDVLRLMADGLDSAEIAEKLSYSERTVKKILYGATHRLNLRNRAHAVAYAMRRGII
jgi:DNA-binding NarL/FixJ family response regulator